MTYGPNDAIASFGAMEWAGSGGGWIEWIGDGGGREGRWVGGRWWW